jgi:hypothetical protein
VRGAAGTLQEKGQTQLPQGVRVHTYFDPTVAACGLPPQDGIVRLWAESWRTHGWEPRILTERLVHADPEFNRFLAKVGTFPTKTARAYENACYLRWLALLGAGGGWLTDYDVINFGFKPRSGRGEVEMMDPTYVPCAVWSTRAGIASIVRMIHRHKPVGDHVSDMHIFKTKFERRKFGAPGTECVEFGVSGWESAPLVHFSAGKASGFGSKVDAIRHAMKIRGYRA